ncbi:sensor histidine kinase [Amycolatopsis cihanbeyliensis]|uniref:histidine kinase n=1 Tax=Amycolatopsis cihanbeyliensis TaxID=1128664 RepID=A0A542DJH8_AMYCI|nr:histidine kinase [Amycolatopsis cihanbeyliensis]TQJ03249.1 signal transduction histidine kinase [Amycolatopsis cihanbeyliensis]
MSIPLGEGPVRGLARGTAGLALGAAAAFAELSFAVLAAPWLALPAARPRVAAGVRALVEWERVRLARYFGDEVPAEYSPGRGLRYLALRSIVGGLGAGTFLLMLYGAVSVAIMAWQAVSGRPIGGGESLDWYDPIVLVLFGGLLAFLAVQGLLGVATLDRRLAKHLLSPTNQELLRRRVSVLTSTRAEVVEAVNDERRRIERALHDGVQQRLVTLGMILGRARRAGAPERSGELLRQAHEQAQQALLDLREVAWRVYPVALDEGGLHSALESLAEHSSVPVVLRYRFAERVDTATETIAYFVVSEAVTNAIKHAAATRIEVDVRPADAALVTVIQDDGIGGARPDGGGLSGLRRRVAAADGEFTVHSPLGGPTTVTAHLPTADGEGQACGW